MVQYRSSYEVPPLGRQNLRDYAKYVRSKLNITTPYFPVVQLLESLNSIIGVDYDIIDDSEWAKRFGEDEHAQYNLTDKIIYVKSSVYEGACNDFGRDRFTIAHEIAHALLLDDTKIKFCRSDSNKPIVTYKNPEWQADCLAGELLVPYHLCKNMSVRTIMKECCVSFEAANYQRNKF
ncbi:MAG: ImmA/IrrE family metallo-endopeptidase [Clostridia bacterium]|nr:ImmA/IrrE family metallo-endopeptidase [Clostridia bacterium]